MSSVRMCDNCGAIFSEAEPGWQTGTVTSLDEDGIRRQVQQDRCQACAVGGKSKALPRPRISADAAPALSAPADAKDATA
jgi:hypothetical protein